MRTLRITLGLLGTAAIGYAVFGIATDPGARPFGQLRFLATVLIGHDLVLMPIAVAIGAAVRRWAPGWARGPISAALFASAIMSLVALPFIVGNGHAPDNPSALPLHYGRGLLVALTTIWLVAAVTAIPGARRARRRPSPTPTTESRVETEAVMLEHEP